MKPINSNMQSHKCNWSSTICNLRHALHNKSTTICLTTTTPEPDEITGILTAAWPNRSGSGINFWKTFQARTFDKTNRRWITIDCNYELAYLQGKSRNRAHRTIITDKWTKQYDDLAPHPQSPDKKYKYHYRLFNFSLSSFRHFLLQPWIPVPFTVNSPPRTMDAFLYLDSPLVLIELTDLFFRHISRSFSNWEWLCPSIRSTEHVELSQNWRDSKTCIFLKASYKWNQYRKE